MLKSKDSLSELFEEICSFLDGLNNAIEINKSETGLSKRVKLLQHRSASISKSSDGNRIIPLEAIQKSEFELERNAELGNTKIIYGHGSDELLRSNGLIAFALANKIYIQTNKYKPETEEGRALLAHELTHVQQYSEKRINNQISKDELEKEAEENYINYPEVTFSTNEAERGVKSWVMAKKNFLFAGSGNRARASCFILSLIETAKHNGIAPEDYLRCLFEKAPYAETEEDWEKLLPWNIEITPYKIRGEWIQQ